MNLPRSCPPQSLTVSDTGGDIESASAPWCLRGPGVAATLARHTDWAATALGPVSAWPASLQSAVAMLLNSRHPMFIWWGPELVQVYNDAYLPSFGRGKHPAAMGQRGADCWPEIWPIIHPQIQDVLREGRPSWHEDQLVPIFRNGRIEEVYWTYGYSPLFGDEGRIAGVLVVCTETTARVFSERQREQLVRELQGASRAKDEFLAMLGHELRNPLTPIVTTLDLLRLRADGPESREHATIRRQVTHMVRLVDDLLDVAKIVSGKVELKRQWIDMAVVMADAVGMAGPLLDQRRHRLELDIAADELQPYFGDPVRLAQCVSNLLTNAARYTPPGGLVRLMAGQQGDSIVIGVSDNGRGIPAELLPEIFGLFVQGERSEDRPEGGLGIGLAIVQNLIGLHGGSVQASSDGAGLGSRFTIRLPKTDEAAAQAEPVAPAEPAMAAVDQALPRVMLVDDNIDALETLAEVLKVSGFEVETAGNPADAIELAARWRPGIAILDVGLPGMDGYQLAAELRRRAAPRQPLRLITLSGYGRAIDRQRAEAMGLERHLVKPVDLDELIDILLAGAASK